ncbi:hypothetical protein KAU43_06675, partial [candidate division WOR-3 bacterium]|nr:hypothetical protein [candidate division WOR-3 bacterium]
MKVIKYFIAIILIFGIYINLLASDYPIISLHGIQGFPVAEEGWKNWNNPYSAIKKILNEEYKGYKWGLILSGDTASFCLDTTQLQSMPDTRRIYNFSYYGYQNVTRGVIGSDGKYEPVRYTAEYNVSNANRQYGYILTQFIYKVLHACYGNNWIYNPDAKVNIVTHSMGGLVARSALTYYLEADRVNKILFVATPNQSFCINEFVEAAVSNSIGGAEVWQKKGELLEMGVDWLCLPTPETRFKDNNEITNQWSNWLRHNEIINNYTTRYATIAGNRAPLYSVTFSPNDGVVMVDQVYLDNAEFNAVIYATHFGGSVPLTDVELGLPTSTFTAEFIKNWMIDDDSSRYGSSISGESYGYDTSGQPFYWKDGSLRIRSCVTDYNKSLVVVAKLIKNTLKRDTTGDTTKFIEEVLAVKAFPIYKYSRSFPGDPVFLTSKAIIEGVGISTIKLDIVEMDMTGEIAHKTQQLTVE